MSHYRRDVVSRGISTGLGLGLRRRISGGALPVLFRWNPEAAQTLPVISTVARGSIKQVLTTTDGTTFWFQEAKSGEASLDRLRRVENVLDASDLTDAAWVKSANATVNASGTNDNGENSYRVEMPAAGSTSLSDFVTYTGRVCFQFRGKKFSPSSNNVTELRILSSPEVNTVITLTDDWETYAIFGDVDGSVQYVFDNDGNSEVVDALLSEVLVAPVQVGNDLPVEFVDPTVEYLNIGVNGVRHFNFANGNTVDGNGLVTQGSGATLVGGGYLPEPAATNQIERSDDYTNGSWIKDQITETDQGLGAIGLNEYELDVGTLNTVHRIRTDALVVGPGTGYMIVRGDDTNSVEFVNLQLGGGNLDYVTFAVVSPSITQVGTAVVEGNIVILGQGYFKAEVSSAAAGTLFNVIATDTGTPGSASSGANTFSGNNELLFINHSQFETTAYSTSPIKTAGGAGTRAADVLDSGVVIPSEFGALFDFTAPDIIGAGNTISLLGPDTSAVPILELDASFNVIMDDGGTPTTIGTVSAGQRFKVSYGRDGTGRSGSLDGATVVTGDAPSAAHEGENFELYSTAGANQARGIGHLSTLYSVRPTDEELESL